MAERPYQPLDVYDAAVPIYYGFATLTNTATLAAPNVMDFNGNDQLVPGTAVTLPATNLSWTGRYRLASIQLMPADSLLTQQEYYVTIQAQGRDLNKGTFPLQAGVTYYPGTLIGEAWDLMINCVCHNLTAATTGNVRLVAGIVRVDLPPGSC